MKIFLMFITLFSLAANLAATGRVIVVGASAGMGREVARVFCKNGYQVGGIARNQVALQSLQDELGANFSYKVGDVQTDACCGVVKQLITEMGGCDIFIMNAGIWDDIRGGITLENVQAYDWAKLLQDQLSTIATNVAGFTRMACVAFEYFVQQRKGHFVGISSVDAVRGNPGGAVYSGSKAFESTYMQGMRSLFEQTGLDIDVTDIRPGYIATYEIKNENAFWVESVEDAGKGIFDAIIDKKKVAYIKARWGYFARYLSSAPDTIYNYVATNFGIR